MSAIEKQSTVAAPTQAHLASLVQMILAEAKTQGATAAEAAVHHQTGLSVTVRLGEVEILEHHRNRSLSVTVYYDHRKGVASSSDWQQDAVRETVQAACAIARHTAADPYAGLPDPDSLATAPPALDLEHPWDLEPAAAIEMATRCEDRARTLDPRICNSEGASVSSSRNSLVYGNSLGFCNGYASTRHALSCSVLGRDEQGMQRDYWYSVARDPAALQDAETVGRQAAERALRRLGARRLSTRKAPVLFAPDMARGLIGHFVAAIRGGALYRKSSFLLDALGRQVFANQIRIREEPHLRAALGSAPFDGEGVATQARDLIRDGVLQGYILDSYSARRLGMQTTGNAGGVHNLIVTPGSDDFTALLRRMGTGLVVTELMGQGVNTVTGDYSRGAGGFWVENGEIRYPVQEITVAGSLQEMFAGIVAIGTDIDHRGVIRCGSLLIDEMTVAGE